MIDLQEHQQVALNMATLISRHKIVADLGVGADIVQLRLAELWGAAIVAPRVAHRAFKNEGFAGLLVTPHWVRRHPRWEPKAVVVGSAITLSKAVARVVDQAEKVSLRAVIVSTATAGIDIVPLD